MINPFKKKEQKEEKAVLAEKKEPEKTKPQEKRTVLLPGSDSILLHPHATEKAGLLSDMGQYVFQVGVHSTKHQVKSAVEHLYNIHVEKVHIVKTPPRMGRDRKSGRRKFMERWEKKAIVSLRKGEKLELLAR
ncbi:MAG: 50S ribosomal protein L23 [bacterium]|nr:50S ribosomal protein L23 [bacterium]